MQRMGFFELPDVAKIVGIPEWKAKNWTVGRPLQITPSLRGGKGRGSLNLYSTADIYLMALAKELYDGGFSSGAINSLIQKLEGKSLQDGEKPLMMVYLKAEEAFMEFISQDWLQNKNSWLATGADSKPLVITLVRIQALAKRINRRIEEFKKKV
jgi:hypothetical protein